MAVGSWRGLPGGIVPADRERFDRAVGVAETIEEREARILQAETASTTAAGAAALDRAQTGQDRSATASDRTQTTAHRSATEQARLDAQAAAVAAAFNARFYDTIAIGRAAVADDESFAVVSRGADGLTRPTIYRRESATTQTPLVEVVAPSEMDDEKAARRAVITDEAQTYMHEFVAKSAINARLRYLLGGFRALDGAWEATKLIARNIAGRVTSGRWVDRILSSDGLTTLMAWDYRGRVRFQPDERTLAYIADNLPVAVGDYPTLTSGPAEFHKPMGAIVGIHAYGQSWEARNAQTGIAQNDVAGYTLAGQRFPRNVLTLNDGRGFLGWEGAAGRVPATAFAAGSETDADIQTLTGALAFRLARSANDEGRPLVVMARTEAKGGTALEVLAPLDLPYAIGDGSCWAAWEGAVQDAFDIAAGLGVPYEVRFIPWTHGQANTDDSYATYRTNLELLLDRMSETVMEITGQTVKPVFLVMQQMPTQNKGYADHIKVTSDLCRERDDCVMVTGGYGHEHIDHIHLTRWASVEVGELRAIAAEKTLRGEPWGGPQLANPRRSGAVVTFDVIGAHDVIADTSIVSDRHQTGGTYNATTGAYTGGAPIPFYGFEASVDGVNVPIASVVVDRRRITLTLASEPSSGTLQVRYAMHNDGTVNSAWGDNRSANRGNIRADWQGRAILTGRPMHRWMASDYFNITI
ncbi:hypothetical protein [Paracoccus aestuariivivens]|uniref:Sialate O-acetylesterase domain-containing protein n=1 Tax=Paracoccus aestuariivivens TaxID=1820333 RepID=A0A6L6J830_9RHOB|nr:hypothetical protein [Paracoccus aestuariivivens]MTH76304.1 hypothetical protein [Paracoccus aestuariivivens]